jgi:hypothetical protein
VAAVGATGTTWAGLFSAIGDRVIDVVTGRRIRRIEEALAVTTARIEAVAEQVGAYADTVEGVRTDLDAVATDIRGDIADLKAQIEAGQPTEEVVARLEANSQRLGTSVSDLGTAGQGLKDLAAENPAPAPTSES